VVSDTYAKAYANECVETARLRAKIKELEQAALLAGDTIACDACGGRRFGELHYAKTRLWRKAALRARCERCRCEVSFEPGLVTTDNEGYGAYRLRWTA